MKLVNSESKSNIITSDDIIVVDNASIGKDLTEVISEHEDRLNRLSSNDKWLYKYGGFGSGGGSGEGGGGSTSAWKVYATLNNQTISGNTFTFSSDVKKFTFHVEVTRPEGQTYRMTITDNNGAITLQATLDASNDWTYNYSLTRMSNSTITVDVMSQFDREHKTTSCNVVTTPYAFKSSFVDSTNKTVSISEGDLFLNSVQNGLKIKIDYNIAVVTSDVTMFKIGQNNLGITTADASSNVINTENIDYPFAVSGSSGSLYFTVPNELIMGEHAEDNAGYYMLPVTFLIHPQNANEETYEINTDFNLIPSTLYLKAQSQSPDYAIYNKSHIEQYNLYETIYNELQQLQHQYDTSVDDTEKAQLARQIAVKTNELNAVLQTISIFPVGAVALTIQGYKGNRSNKSFNIEVRIQGPNDADYVLYPPERLGYTAIDERKTYIINLVPGDSIGEYKIKFTLKHSTGQIIDSKDFIYYMYLGDVNSDIVWYKQTPYQGGNYYRAGSSSELLSVLNSATIDMKANYASRELFNDASAYITNNEHDELISIGIQYSVINDTNNPIMILNSGATTGNLTVYQNRIVIGNFEATIFLPKEKSFSSKDDSKYHLLTIYKRRIKTKSNAYMYETNIYLDDTLEGSFSNFTQAYGYVSCTLYPGNYSLNMFEMSYFENTATEDGQIVLHNQLSDIDISQYYYKYCETCKHGVDLNERFIDLLKYMTYFKEDDDTGMIHVTNSAAISNIASEINVPVLLLEYNEKDNTETVNNVSRGIDFVTWFTTAYAQDKTGQRLRISKVYYSNGNDSLAAYDIPTNTTGFSNSYFYIDIQGSSTKQRKSKNLNLGIYSGEAGYTVLYTPNFKNIDNDTMTADEKNECYNTFLPETKFTLKADVVDSTHSNNTAIGAFVNTNTTKFDTGSTGKYKNYVKNCLLGFVTLVFVNVTHEDTTTDCYYLGVYNFNLGRDSYMNMGYINPNVLDNYEIRDGFGFYTITDDENKFVDGLIVAEIQDNNTHWDFSQYNNTVLFPDSKNDTAAMFGDFVPEYEGNAERQQFVQSNISSFVKSVSLSGGYIFNMLGKHMSNSETDNYGYDKGYFGCVGTDVTKSANTVPNYIYQFIRRDNNYTYDKQGEVGTRDSLQRLVLGTTATDGTEYKPRLNYSSCVEYYTTCMAFGLVDSVQKNMNIKTWNANHDAQSTFYIAFYDMDTCLGRDNAGNKVAYFAFSDYWNSKLEDTQESGYKDTKTINALHVYTDFYPKNTITGYEQDIPIGYDIPSSYLFAIAKYAKYFKYTDPTDAESAVNVTTILSKTPEILWGDWRNSTGPCRSAEYFIDKYFIRNMDDIPGALFSLNYRFKYLSRAADTYDGTNFVGFHGRGIYELQDWLSGRFHILDAYFNMNSVNDYVQTLVYDGETPRIVNGEPVWKNLTFNTEQVKEIHENFVTNETRELFVGKPASVDSTNSDIYVLKDIFNAETSTSVGQKYSSGSLVFAVKSLDYSPFLIYTPSWIYRYLFEDSEQKYFVRQNVDGNQNIAFLGSKMWTWLDNINFGITDSGTITINAEYLDNLNGTRGTCNFVVGCFNTPSVRTITLTSENYTGTLQCAVKESGEDPFQNIDNINISGSRLSLAVDGEGVTVINASNIKNEQGELSVKNCYNLKSIDMTGSIFKSCIITPVWSDNVNFNNTSIETFVLSGKTGDNNTVHISGDQTCTSVTLTNFQHIYISNCEQLSNIIITDIQNVKTLSIESCNTLPTTTQGKYTYNYLNVGVNNENPTGEIDLSGFINLESLSFAGTRGFTHVNIPTETKLIERAFENTTLKTIDIYTRPTNSDELPQVDNGTDDTDWLSGGKHYTTGYLRLMGPSIFANTIYGMLNRSNVVNRMIVDASVTNISGMFSYIRSTSSTSTTSQQIGNITTNLAAAFLHSENVCKYEQIENITNISSLFRGQNIIYGVAAWNTDVKTHELNYNSSLSLGTFVGATDASNVFRNTGGSGNGSGFTCLSAESFRWYTDSTKTQYTVLGGNNVESVLNINVISMTITHMTDNVFTDIIDRLQYIINDSRSGSNINIEIIHHETGNTYYDETLNLRNLFIGQRNGQPIYPRRVLNLYVLNFKDKGSGTSKITLDFDRLFDNSDNTGMWVSLKSISYSFNSSISNYANLNTMGLKSLTNLQTIEDSFTFNNENDPIDYYNFVNWTQIYNPSNTTGLYAGQTCNFYKYITKADLKTLCKEIGSTATVTNYLFRKLILIIDSIENNDLILTDDYDNCLINVEQAQYMFSEMYMVDKNNWNGTSVIDKAQIIPIHLSSDTLKSMPNLTDVSYMFYNTTLDGNLPYNFFNKKTGKTTKDVYCKNELGESIHAELTYPVYNSTKIIAMESTFANVKIKNKYAGENNHKTYFDDLASLLQDYSLIADDGNTYDWYYTQSNLSDIPTPFLNHHIEGNYVNGWQITVETVSYGFYNNVLIGNKEDVCSHYILPPDIFWGCIPTTRLTNCFANSQFEGVLPSPLIKDFTSSQYLSGMFTNLNVIPNKFETLQLNETLFDIIAGKTFKENVTTTNNIYVYIPKYFVKTANISGLFNFNLNVPQSETLNGLIHTYDSYYLMYKTSIPKDMATMHNAFPQNQNQITYKRNNTDLHEPDFHTYDFGVHYNIMIDDEATLQNFNAETITSENNEVYYADESKYGANVVKCMRTVLVEGIDASYFSSLIPTGILNEHLSAIYYGYIFTPGTFDASSYTTPKGSTEPVFTVGNGQSLELSQNAVLPYSEGRINEYFIKFNGKSSNNVNNTWKEQVEDYVVAFYKSNGETKRHAKYQMYVERWNLSKRYLVDMYEYGNNQPLTLGKNSRPD